jgi:SNF2 family DNA or RNA helicase
MKKVVRLDASGEGLEDIIQGNESARVFLITYARLYINSEIIAQFMGTADWSMILDESHNIKRHSGAYSRAVRRIGSMARCSRVILTGTPAPQGAEDLWPQAEFLRNARMSSADSAEWISGIKVRTTKEELGLLCTQLIPIRQALPPAHQNLYDLITSRLARRIASGTDTEKRRRLDGLRSHIMDIMRAASNPAILCNIPEFAEALGPQGVADILVTPSWKVEETLRIVSDLIRDGRKVIIWSYFNDNTDILANRLKHCNPRIIRGDTPSSHSVIEDEELDERTREGILHDFKTRDDCNIIIANPAACGESISLHHWCHDAIYFDRSYNAGQYLQSCDRIHRFGYHPKTGRNTCAKETVTYYILESTGTIDERISTRLTDKIDRQEAILNSGDYTQPLTESGSSRRDATGMSDLDREDFVDHIRDVGGF